MPHTPKDWKNLPDRTTPLDADGLKDLEERLAGYTDEEIAAARTYIDDEVTETRALIPPDLPDGGPGVLTRESSDGAPTWQPGSISDLVLVPGQTIMCMGDSISANGWGGTGADGTCISMTSGRAYLGWAVLLSMGRLTLTAPANKTVYAATGGYTAQQIIDTHLPTVIAHKPALCTVLAGTNDPMTSDANLAALQTKLKTLWHGLLDAGIMPVAGTLPPKNSTDLPSYGLTRINMWIRRYCAANGIPCADYFAALVDPATSGNYLAGLNLDTVHPNSAGGKAMGQALWDALDPIVPKTYAPLALHNSKGAGDTLMLNTNPLNLTDAGADGIPDGFTLNAGAGTTDLATAAPVGKWWHIARGASNLSYVTNSFGFAPTLNDGDRVYLAARLKVVTGTMLFKAREADAATFNGPSLDTPLIEGVWSSEWTWKNASGGAGNRLYWEAGGAGAEGSIAQITFMNLTTGKIASVVTP